MISYEINFICDGAWPSDCPSAEIYCHPPISTVELAEAIASAKDEGWEFIFGAGEKPKKAFCPKCAEAVRNERRKR